MKLQKGCRKRICRAGTDGGNAPAPLGQSKLPRHSISVWVWTSGPVWVDLCALAVLVTPGWCFASRAHLHSALRVCATWMDTLPSVLQLQPTLEGTGLYGGSRPT